MEGLGFFFFHFQRRRGNSVGEKYKTTSVLSRNLLGDVIFSISYSSRAANSLQ